MYASARYLTEKLSRALIAALCKEIHRWGMLDHHASIGKVDLVDFASKGHLVGDDDAGHAILRELADGDQNLFHGFRIQYAGDLVEQHDFVLLDRSWR